MTNEYALCPYCFTPIGKQIADPENPGKFITIPLSQVEKDELYDIGIHVWEHDDPLLNARGANYSWLLDENGDISSIEANHIGFTQLKEEHIQEIQDLRTQQELDYGVSSTEFSSIKITDSGMVQWNIKHIIELRQSTEKILEAIGLTLEDYLNYDMVGNKLTEKNIWTDNDLETADKKVNIKYSHIEELRHQIPFPLNYIFSDKEYETEYKETTYFTASTERIDGWYEETGYCSRGGHHPFPYTWLSCGCLYKSWTVNYAFFGDCNYIWESDCPSDCIIEYDNCQTSWKTFWQDGKSTGNKTASHPSLHKITIRVPSSLYNKDEEGEALIKLNNMSLLLYNRVSVYGNGLPEETPTDFIEDGIVLGSIEVSLDSEYTDYRGRTWGIFKYEGDPYVMPRPYSAYNYSVVVGVGAPIVGTWSPSPGAGSCQYWDWNASDELSEFPLPLVSIWIPKFNDFSRRFQRTFIYTKRVNPNNPSIKYIVWNPSRLLVKENAIDWFASNYFEKENQNISKARNLSLEGKPIQSTVIFKVNGQTWGKVNDITSVPKGSLTYEVDTDNSRLLFGDDENYGTKPDGDYDLYYYADEVKIKEYNSETFELEDVPYNLDTEQSLVFVYAKLRVHNFSLANAHAETNTDVIPPLYYLQTYEPGGDEGTISS